MGGWGVCVTILELGMGALMAGCESEIVIGLLGLDGRCCDGLGRFGCTELGGMGCVIVKVRPG
jgi:hypothetical protein